jgi:hypothetical protein
MEFDVLLVVILLDRAPQIVDETSQVFQSVTAATCLQVVFKLIEPSARPSHLQLSAIYSLCRQLICTEGEFANEYGCPIEGLAV